MGTEVEAKGKLVLFGEATAKDKFDWKYEHTKSSEDGIGKETSVSVWRFDKGSIVDIIQKTIEIWVDAPVAPKSAVRVFGYVINGELDMEWKGKVRLPFVTKLNI